MKHRLERENSITFELLEILRRERFSAAGWWHFLARSWKVSCRTAKENPTLKRSWARVTLLVVAVAAIIVALNVFFEGGSDTLRLLPGFAFCVIWQQSDLFWHLGLNRQVRTGKLLPVVGFASTLTWLRGLAASYLLGRLLGGIGTPPMLALAVFLAGVGTDMLDGPVARLTRTQSKLGQIADGEADLCLYVAMTLILLQDGLLPLWLGLVLLLRFIAPLMAALASYFLLTRAVRFGSTWWGKGAGVLQTIYFLALLAPAPLAVLTHSLDVPLFVLLLFFMIMAPVAMIVKNLRATAAT